MQNYIFMYNSTPKTGNCQHQKHFMYVSLDYDEISARILCSVYIDIKEQMFYNDNQGISFRASGERSNNMTEDERYVLCESIARRIVRILIKNPDYTFPNSAISLDFLSAFSIPDSSDSHSTPANEHHPTA